MAGGSSKLGHKSENGCQRPRCSAFLRRRHQLPGASTVFGKLNHHCRLFRPNQGRSNMAASEISSPKTKIWLAVVGIVVVAGVAYVANIYPPSDETLVGSVVPADRYRAESVTTKGSGSTLGDQSVAQFMQTDIYHKIVSDKALGAAFASD